MKLLAPFLRKYVYLRILYYILCKYPMKYLNIKYIFCDEYDIKYDIFQCYTSGMFVLVQTSK